VHRTRPQDSKIMVLQIIAKLCSVDILLYPLYSFNKNKNQRHRKIPYHLFVNKPSTPTGPLACILLVLIPTWSTNNKTKNSR